MESATTLDDPCVLTCIASPARLLCVLFGRDGEISPSWMTLAEKVQSCDHCMSQEFNGVIVLFGKTGYEIIHIKEGVIASDTTTISHSAKSYSSVLFVKNWCLFCDTDSFYASDTARRPTSDVLQSKAKVNISSEIGPQNKLLLSKDKSVVKEMHKVNTNGTDIIIVTTHPTTGLCSIHWATPELPSTIHLKWSLALTQDRVVIASNTLPMNSADAECITWACMIVASTLKVLSRSGVMGSVDLSTSCPAVVGAVVLNTTDAHSATSTSKASVEESALTTTTATVLLSCVGDRYFALTLHITTASCCAVSICERFFLLPSETSCARINNADAVRRTRTMLPCCETLVRIPSTWLQGETNNHNNDLVILLGFHAHFGVQLIIEDAAVPHLSTDERTKLVNAADKVQNTFFKSHQSISLNPRDLENVEDTNRWLTSNDCVRTQQAAVYKLSQNKVRLETSARFELDADSFYNDTQVYMVYPTRADTEAPLLVMLSSRQAQQSSMYTVTLNTNDKQYGSLLPLSQALYQSEQSSLGLFALKDCVAQVTSCGLNVWNNKNYQIQIPWSQLLQDAVTKGMRITAINQAGSRTEMTFPSDKAATFRAQFVISVSATCLVAVCEDILVHVKVCTSVGNTFSLSVLHVVQLHAAVCAVTSGPAQDGDQAGFLFVSLWPDSQKVGATCGNNDSVLILRCSESTGIHYMHQVEHIAHGLAHEPLRYLSTISLYHTSTVQLFALLCAYPGGQAALYHVLYNVRDNTVEHGLVRTLNLAGGVGAMVTVESSTYHTFLVSNVTCQYAITAGSISADLDVLDIKDLCAVASWRCNETSSHKGMHRVSFTSTAKNTLAGSKMNPVAWIELAGFANSRSGQPVQLEHPALCFRFLHAHEVMSDHAEDRLFLPGQVVCLDTSSSKKRFLVLSADLAGDSLIGAAPALVAQQVVVRQGEVSLYDTESFACVWRQRLTSTDPSMPLLGMVAGPKTSLSVRPLSNNTTVISLLHGHVLSDVVTGPSAVLSAVSLTTLQITEESDAPAQVNPIGSIRIFVDIRRLAQTPPVVESSTTTATAVPPPEPHLEGFINNALHCRALAECVVLCLPGNTLSLVGWSNKGEQFEKSVKLVEHMRIDLQDKNAAVLEMVTLGSSHVVLSLALVGLEIYTLIPGCSTEAPLLQFTHAISNTGCLWSELCAKELGYEERTGDTNAILTVHDKMKDTAHEISLFLPSPQSMLTGSVLNCQVKPAPPLRI